MWGDQAWNGFEEFVRSGSSARTVTRDEWRPDLIYVETVFPVNGTSGGGPLPIGYAGLAYMDEQEKLLAVAPAEGGPYIAPSYERGARRLSVEARVTYINLNSRRGQHLRSGAGGSSTRFILSREGQQVSGPGHLHSASRSSGRKESAVVEKINGRGL